MSTPTIFAEKETSSSGKKCWVLTVSEAAQSSGVFWRSDVANGIPEAEMPRNGYMWFRWAKGSGSSAVCKPRLGSNTAAWADASVDKVRTVPADSSFVEDGPFPFAFRHGVAKVLFGTSGFLSGSDNVAEWTVVIEPA